MIAIFKKFTFIYNLSLASCSNLWPALSKASLAGLGAFCASTELSSYDHISVYFHLIFYFLLNVYFLLIVVLFGVLIVNLIVFLLVVFIVTLVLLQIIVQIVVIIVIPSFVRKEELDFFHYFPLIVSQIVALLFS